MANWLDCQLAIVMLEMLRFVLFAHLRAAQSMTKRYFTSPLSRRS